MRKKKEKKVETCKEEEEDQSFQGEMLSKDWEGENNILLVVFPLSDHPDDHHHGVRRVFDTYSCESN